MSMSKNADILNPLFIKVRQNLQDKLTLLQKQQSEQILDHTEKISQLTCEIYANKQKLLCKRTKLLLQIQKQDLCSDEALKETLTSFQQKIIILRLENQELLEQIRLNRQLREQIVGNCEEKVVETDAVEDVEEGEQLLSQDICQNVEDEHINDPEIEQKEYTVVEVPVQQIVQQEINDVIQNQEVSEQYILDTDMSHEVILYSPISIQGIQPDVVIINDVIQQAEIQQDNLVQIENINLQEDIDTRQIMDQVLGSQQIMEQQIDIQQVDKNSKKDENHENIPQTEDVASSLVQEEPINIVQSEQTQSRDIDQEEIIELSETVEVENTSNNDLVSPVVIEDCANLDITRDLVQETRLNDNNEVQINDNIQDISNQEQNSSQSEQADSEVINVENITPDLILEENIILADNQDLGEMNEENSPDTVLDEIQQEFIVRENLLPNNEITSEQQDAPLNQQEEINHPSN